MVNVYMYVLLVCIQIMGLELVVLVVWRIVIVVLLLEMLCNVRCVRMGII